MTRLNVVIMAAGLGSRYGGLKQIDEFGPSQEYLMDYAIYDAYKAGIRQVTLIVRESFLKEIQELMQFKWRLYRDLKFSFVCQETTDVPVEYAVGLNREKPWGTAHILYVLRQTMKSPFMIMNADDFYGRPALSALGMFLAKNPEQHAMVGYSLQKTLSSHGPVTRGLCEIRDGQLVAIDEVSGIEFNDPRQVPASMNLWGFAPSIFTHVEESFKKFLAKSSKDPKSEYQIPQMVNDFLKEDKIEIQALNVDSDWFGVTHKEDKPIVQKKIQDLVNSGVYPENLFLGK